MSIKTEGYVCIDSGEMIIIDPCHKDSHPELGVTFSGFGGDGRYKVNLIRNEKGLVVQALIYFHDSSETL